MTTRKFRVIMAVACAAVCIRAAERTWTGGGGDAKWSTPANWGGTAPTTNDTLVFSGAAYVANTNDLADDTPFAGITFSGTSAFTLNGAPSGVIVRRPGRWQRSCFLAGGLQFKATTLANRQTRIFGIARIALGQLAQIEPAAARVARNAHVPTGRAQADRAALQCVADVLR